MRDTRISGQGLESSESLAESLADAAESEDNILIPPVQDNIPPRSSRRTTARQSQDNSPPVGAAC